MNQLDKKRLKTVITLIPQNNDTYRHTNHKQLFVYI